MSDGLWPERYDGFYRKRLRRNRMKAGRNKTIDISIEEGRCYLERCIHITEPASLEQITDKTIVGDTFEILPLLPEGFVDLLVVDPPYNLDKDFHGNKFKKLLMICMKSIRKHG